MDDFVKSFFAIYGKSRNKIFVYILCVFSLAHTVSTDTISWFFFFFYRGAYSMRDAIRLNVFVRHQRWRRWKRQRECVIGCHESQQQPVVVIRSLVRAYTHRHCLIWPKLRGTCWKSEQTSELHWRNQFRWQTIYRSAQRILSVSVIPFVCSKLDLFRKS